MMKVFLDAGHGALDPVTGEYTTPAEKGKRFFHRDFKFYEGVFNRKVADKLELLLTYAGIKVVKVYHPHIDSSLRSRVSAANSVAEPEDIFVSIHANAVSATFEGQGSKATGIETFCYKTGTEGHKLAKAVQKHLIGYTGLPNRGVKTANFTVVKRTSIPAILTENGFFDNYEEAKKLMSNDMQNKIALAHFEGILEYINAR